MKKLILIIATSMILPYAYGQSTTTTTTTTTESERQNSDENSPSGDFKRGYIGARALATVTSLKLKSVDNSTVSTSLIVGYGGGGVIGANFSRHIGAQAEVLYSALAQSYKDNSGIDRTLHINYLNVPLLFLLNTDASRGLNLNICAGPQLGINTGSSLKTKSSNIDNVDTVNAVLAVKTGDIGFAYGIGLDFMIGPSIKLSVGYRGVRGLIDISDDSKNTTTNEYYILDRAHVNTNSGYAGLAICF